MKNIALSNGKKVKILVSVCLLISIVSCVFLPSLMNGFVNFDDDAYVTTNPLIKDLSWVGIKRIFTPTAYISENSASSQLYVPLVTLTYALEYHFFNLNPFIYHVTNLLLHLFNCLLIFLFFYLISNKIIVAFIVSIMFGVHPLRVESVAWITERKDVLYSFFFLAALVFYVYYKMSKKRNILIAIYCLFTLALLSKPASLTLPVLLLLCDYFIDGRITLSQVRDKIPFFLIVLIFSLMSRVMTGYLQFDPAFNFFDYVLVPFYCLMFSLGKIIIPTGLSCLYPYPLKNGNFLPFAFFVSPMLIIGLGSVVVYSKRYTRKLVFGFLFFLITIFPYLRILPFVAPTLVSDHYTYLASIGIFFIFAESVVFMWRKNTKYKNTLQVALILFCLVIVILLSHYTWNRCKVWKDGISLWSDAINKHPKQYIPIAYFNRGIAEMALGENENSVSDFNHALALYYKKLNLGYEYAKKSNSVLKGKNKFQELYNILAVRFAEVGRYKEAELIFKELLSLNPNETVIMSDLGSLYGNTGDFDKALLLWQKALEIKPDDEGIRQNIQRLKVIRGY